MAQLSWTVNATGSARDRSLLCKEGKAEAAVDVEGEVAAVVVAVDEVDVVAVAAKCNMEMSSSMALMHLILRDHSLMQSGRLCDPMEDCVMFTSSVGSLTLEEEDAVEAVVQVVEMLAVWRQRNLHLRRLLRRAPMNVEAAMAADLDVVHMEQDEVVAPDYQGHQ